MEPDCRRIAVVIPKYGLTGGAEDFTAELTERIARNPRYDIHVLANKWAGPAERIIFHKVPIITFPKFLTTISFAWFAARLISKIGFDLVHAQDRIFEADIFTMHGIPHCLWVREIRGKSMSLYDRVTAWVEKKLVTGHRCRYFLAVSGLAKEKFLQAYGTDSRMVQIVHPGVDTEKYAHLDRKLCRREIRREYGIGTEDTLLLFVAMNFDIKGLDRLITALAILKSERPGERFKLLVVGKGNIRKYLRLAGKLDIADRVVFTGVMGKEKLDRTYMASDIFAILSRFDTFGMVVLEAMAASLPVVVTECVGAKDLVRDGINGFIVEGGDDAMQISGKIAFLLDREKRLIMGEKAHATALSCTWEKVAQRVGELYEKVHA
ncbi:MAG: hypothetical protein A2V87_08030 [Deltaproteobacteria bacterium RBG_16_58_17]|nr:MAG: hypothetical protein A2V87_08030 [Deltaproteobacteria bacterium RBG_16_58_17]OHE19037.1 MAG: hypothetical protein A2X96_07050 [Syntrophobacterales bacterium GWC2_56_13]OHE20430.1 MAG: hypothetical protein A2X95_04215 [Syntrophobacterales bacterium GWF2_56_9]